MKKITLIVENGIRTFEFDISKKACHPFGFYYGDRILTPLGREAAVLGVFDNCLWYQYDRNKEINHWGDGKKDDLIRVGFQLIKRHSKAEKRAE